MQLPMLRANGLNGQPLSVRLKGAGEGIWPPAPPEKSCDRGGGGGGNWHSTSKRQIDIHFCPEGCVMCDASESGAKGYGCSNTRTYVE